MKEMKKILIVHNYYQNAGGEDTVVRNEKKLLEEHGNEVIFYNRNNLEIQNMFGIYKLLLPFIAIFNFRTYFEIKKLIKEEDIDIVHVHNTLFFISPAVYYAAKRCRIPVVQTVHNFRFLCPNATFFRDGHICEACLKKGLKCAVKYRCYRNSREQTLVCVINTKIHRMIGIYGKINYICLSKFNENKLLSLKQIVPERVFVKPNFGENEPESILCSERKNQYIFAGRLEKLKGIDKLLKAWKELEHERRDKTPKLVVCGIGSLEEWCKLYIAKNKLKSINMQGSVPNIELKKIMAVSKALILPTQWYEGFPMVIAEAYSVGIPIIGSDIGNTKALIKAGETGECFIYNSPESLVEAIDRFESGDMEKYRENAYAFYKNNFTPEINYKRLMEIYEALQS